MDCACFDVVVDCGEAPTLPRRVVEYIDDGNTTFGSRAVYSCVCSRGSDVTMYCSADASWGLDAAIFDCTGNDLGAMSGPT